MREEILGTTERHFTQFAEVLAEAARQGAICVLGGPKTEEAAQAHGWAAQRLL